LSSASTPSRTSAPWTWDKENLPDVAVLEHEDLDGTKALTKRYPKCDEVPFGFSRRRMSVVVHEVFRGRDLLICKGAVEEVLAVWDRVRVGGQVLPLDDELRQRTAGLCARLNSDGLRVIAVAFRQVDSRPGKQYGVADEAGLTLVIAAVGVIIPFSPLGAAVGLMPLPQGYFLCLGATLAGYCVLVQVMKCWYIRRFGTWL
jgi:hypothetical protein